MPTSNEHERQAQKNETLAERLDTQFNQYEDWVVTTMFYSALHYVECELTKHGMSASNHGERQRKINQCKQIPGDVYRLYRTLEDLSRDARYECVSISAIDVLESHTKLDRIKDFLGYP